MKRILAPALTAALLLAGCAAHTPAAPTQTPTPPAVSEAPAVQTPAPEPRGAESAAALFTAGTTVAEAETDPAFAVRLACCLSCGIAAALLVHAFYRGKPFFDFTGFEPRPGRDTDPNPLLRFLKNLGRNLKATGPWFLAEGAALGLVPAVCPGGRLCRRLRRAALCLGQCSRPWH